jgi:hypothetical protein
MEHERTSSRRREGSASAEHRALLGNLRMSARNVLERNHRHGQTPDGVGFAYTRPDNDKYPDQFYWDSCLIALAWSRLDPSRARDELRTLAAAMQPSGHIGHTVFWSGPVRLARLPAYNVRRRSDRSTATIQPPLLGWAWAEIADRSPDDPQFRAEGRAVVRHHLEWLERARAEADGLIGVLQPDETGLDATPTYDLALGWRAHPYPGFAALVHENRRRGFDYHRARAAGAFTAIDVLVNTAWALSWYGLARLGDPEAGARAADIVAALETRLWDAEHGMFFAEGPDRTRLPVSTWAGLAPLTLPGLSPDIAARLIDDQLLNPSRFWLPWPVPSTSAEEPSFRPGDTGWPIRRYWRGPTWPFTWWFAHLGLRVHGRDDTARELAVRIALLIDREGMREYYNPISGRGLGARHFAVSAIALDLLTASTA